MKILVLKIEHLPCYVLNEKVKSSKIQYSYGRILEKSFVPTILSYKYIHNTSAKGREL